jgi:hypothetical protein
MLGRENVLYHYNVSVFGSSQLFVWDSIIAYGIG